MSDKHYPNFRGLFNQITNVTRWNTRPDKVLGVIQVTAINPGNGFNGCTYANYLTKLLYSPELHLMTLSMLLAHQNQVTKVTFRVIGNNQNHLLLQKLPNSFARMHQVTPITCWRNLTYLREFLYLPIVFVGQIPQICCWIAEVPQVIYKSRARALDVIERTCQRSFLRLQETWWKWPN